MLGLGSVDLVAKARAGAVVKEVVELEKLFWPGGRKIYRPTCLPDCSSSVGEHTA